MSRSKVIVENNLKPSQFGKLPTADNEDDFDQIYENPLDKSKPLPPCPAGPSEELSRNEPESMEFSNASIIRRNSEKRPEVETNVYTSVEKSDEEETRKESPGTSDFVNSKIVTAEVLVESVEDVSRGSPETSGSKERLTGDSNAKEQANREKADLSLKTIINVAKSLDANRYATKKTIAQGMLDIALLTANASQLKYILQVGKQHEFYTLMLSLICVSIGLQLLQGIICVLLGSSFNINKQQDQRKANIWNNICLTMMLLTVAVNAVISAFDMRDINAVQAGSAGKAANTQGSGVR